MPSGPLSGILVVDLTRVLAGPFCTMVLADLGARVIKVEAPDGGDDARRIGPFVDGRSAYFESVNRGKQSIALDLKDDADRGVFEKLLAKADVLVENFRPGAMKRLGYDWQTLHARHPALVMASTSGSLEWKTLLRSNKLLPNCSINHLTWFAAAHPLLWQYFAHKYANSRLLTAANPTFLFQLLLKGRYN